MLGLLRLQPSASKRCLLDMQMGLHPWSCRCFCTALECAAPWHLCLPAYKTRISPCLLMKAPHARCRSLWCGCNKLQPRIQACATLLLQAFLTWGLLVLSGS